MEQYDVEMTYRTCSQVPVDYFLYYNVSGTRSSLLDASLALGMQAILTGVSAHA